MRLASSVLFVVGLAGAISCSGSREPHQNRASSGPPTRHHAKADAPSYFKVDVPSLLFLSVDELIQRVGPLLPVPADFSDPVLPSTNLSHQSDSTAFFERRGLQLVASYNYHTRQVNDLLLLGNNEEELMQRTKLQLGRENYLVLPVFHGQRSTQLLGLRVLAITPHP